MALDLNPIRAQFPALSRPYIFLDNPGGTQIAKASLERIRGYLENHNANHGGVFRTSQESDALVDTSRQAAAEFLNASRPEEIVFGPNMTSLTFNISRSLGRVFKPGDTLVVTRLDHDANISPWLLMAEDRGLKVRWVNFHKDTGLLDMEDMAAALNEKPALVAVGYSSNALGTINPIREITAMAHAAGALIYVDAVQYAPHGPIDVQDLGVDFLVCSPYKFFGPHMGVLYGRYDLLESLPAYRVRPAPAHAPGKFETGTGNFEHMAGLLGTLEYLEWLGNAYGEEHAELYASHFKGRVLALKQAMSASRAYEYELSAALLDILTHTPGVHLYGPADPQHLDQRVPTFSFTVDGWSPEAVAAAFAQRSINLWNGNFYALAVTAHLGLEDRGGLVRVGAAHYNTLDEIGRFGEVLAELAAQRPQ